MNWQYVVLLGAVVAIGAFLLPKKKAESAASDTPRSVQNMETALEQFMENMERDNEELMSLVKQSQEDARRENDRKDKRIASLELRCEQLAEHLQSAMKSLESTSAPKQAKTAEAAAVPAAPMRPAEQPNQQEIMPTASIQSRYAELFRLYSDGKSIEAIAKKLGMNKGEVGLIIGLAKQEGAAHV